MDKPGDIENRADAGVEIPWAHPAGKLRRVHRSLDAYYACELFACVAAFIMMAVMGSLAVMVLQAMGAQQLIEPLAIPVVIYSLLTLLFWKLFSKHRFRARLIKHGSWVVNHIPPEETESVTMCPSFWSDEPKLSIDGTGVDKTPRSYRVFAGSSGFTKVVWFPFQQLVEHHSVRLYRDPMTKQPVAIEKAGRLAILLPLKQKKAPAQIGDTRLKD